MLTPRLLVLQGIANTVRTGAFLGAGSRLQGHPTGCRTGNGGKVSNS